MISPLTDYETLPFEPGTSPFHIKGVAYRAHVEYARSEIPGGEKAVIGEFQKPVFKHFFEQQFLASTWYDVFPMLPVWQICARLMRQTPTEFLKARTRHQALLDINGVYKVLLKIASPETVALRMPRLVSQYFDFGKTTANVVRPGLVRIEHSGVPTLIVPWFLTVGETYLTVALELAGGKKFQIRRHPTIPRGDLLGVPVVSTGCDIVLNGA